MRSGIDNHRGVWSTRWVTVAVVVALAMLAVACGGPETASESESDVEPFDDGPLTAEAPAACGEPVVFDKSDPDAVLAALDPSVQSWWDPYPFEVRASAWEDFEGTPGPWTIGYVSFPIANPFKVNYYDQLQAEFAEAEAAGLVEGPLRTFIQPSFDTATPEEQSAAIAQMVSDGVDGILVHPLNANALTPAIDAAGEAGVPVVLTGDVAPGSRYAINTLTENQSPAFAGFFRLLVDQGWFSGEPRTALVVQGLAGNSFSEQINEASTAVMEPCEGVEIAGTVFGEWDPAITKREVLQFLASHPDDIDFVMHQGAMAAGIIEAFEEAGRPVPPMPISGHTGGDLSWWAANKDTFESVGVHTMGGRQVAWSTFQILLRVLDGKGLTIRDIAPPGNLVTNENVDDYAVPDQPVTWLEDVHFRGPLDDWLSDEQMDQLFRDPGPAGS